MCSLLLVLPGDGAGLSTEPVNPLLRGKIVGVDVAVEAEGNMNDGDCVDVAVEDKRAACREELRNAADKAAAAAVTA